MKTLYLIGLIIILCSTMAQGKTVIDLEERAAFIDTATISGNEVAVVTMMNDSEFRIVFFPDDAPNTVKSFIYLTRVGFYDSLSFHRVIKDPPFVAQGGDPRGDGTGGPGYTIDAEFNDRLHKEGTLSMARSSDPNSAGSQFYICLASQPHLDGNYTVFGEVIEGMDIVKDIEQGDIMKSIMIVTPSLEGKK
ncbi:peptidylprolyl isomerase [candidate division WOR-3 bacterium]|nr:peptidylprolyl isomerase [candidate division WOR-3 bacterium]